MQAYTASRTGLRVLCLAIHALKNSAENIQFMTLWSWPFMQHSSYAQNHAKLPACAAVELQARVVKSAY